MRDELYGDTESVEEAKHQEKRVERGLRASKAPQGKQSPCYVTTL